MGLLRDEKERKGPDANTDGLVVPPSVPCYKGAFCCASHSRELSNDELENLLYFGWRSTKPSVDISRARRLQQPAISGISDFIALLFAEQGFFFASRCSCSTMLSLKIAFFV